jgi:predicted TIM-barrel fold metal-dependent hydrolase
VWVTPFWEDDVITVIPDVPATRLLLGSDWPHAEGTAAPADFVTESLGELPEADVRRVARGNALDLLGITLG